MKSRFKQFFVILFSLFIITPCLLSLHSVIAETNDVESSLLVANDAINQAFSAILQAEKAGANVTSLLVRLNEVATILARDEASYRNNKQSAAITNLNIVISAAGDVKSEAIKEGNNAAAVANEVLWTSLAVLVIGEFVLLFVLLYIWRFKVRPRLEPDASAVQIKISKG
jgi:hypothetical protein